MHLAPIPEILWMPTIKGAIWVSWRIESWLSHQMRATIATEDAQAAAVRSKGQDRSRCDGQAPRAVGSGDQGSQRRGVSRSGASTLGLPTLSESRFRGGRLGVELARLQAWSPVSLVRGLEGPRSGSEEHRLRLGASGKVPGLALRDSEPVDADGFCRGASGLPADG